MLSYIWVLLLAHTYKWSTSSIKLFSPLIWFFYCDATPIKISDSSFKATYISVKWKAGRMEALSKFSDVLIVSFIFNLHKLCTFHQLNVVKKISPQGQTRSMDWREQRQASWLSQECVPLGAMRWGATIFFAEHKLMIIRCCWISVCHRALVHPPVTGDNKSRGAVLPRQRFSRQIDSNSSYVRIHFFIPKDC